MKNSDLARKLRELRTRKGFSQEELAEKTQLSLRTVQRIENGETEARGDTVRRMAVALNVTPDELFEWAEHEDKEFLAFMNLSALSFLAYPILGIVVPLALWVLRKDKIKSINETGKSLLNFQITFCILYYVCIFLGTSNVLVPVEPFPEYHNVRGIFIVLSYGLYGLNLVLIILNSIQAFNSKAVFYKPAIPFLR